MFRVTNLRLSTFEVKIRFIQMLLLTSPLIGSYFFIYSGYNSPFSCPIRNFTGIPCPSCGLTRSFLALSGGNLFQSFSYHLFGPIIYFNLIIFSLHLVLEIYYQRKIKNKYTLFLIGGKKKYLIVLSFMIYYVIRLLNLYFNGDLLDNFQHSPLADILYKFLELKRKS